MPKQIDVYEKPEDLLDAISNKKIEFEVVLRFEEQPHFNASTPDTVIDMNATVFVEFLNQLFKKYDIPASARINSVSRFY